MADGTLDKPVKPTEDISVREVFGIDSDMKVKGFAEKTDRVPEIDSTYKPSNCAMACRSLNFMKVFCRGPCATRSPSCSMNMTQAALT